MQFHRILEERKSVREFRDKSLSKEHIYALQESFYKSQKLIQDLNVDFHFLADGNRAHEALLGYAGYHGRAIEAPHYMVITSEKKEGYLINAGYIMEQILLKAYELEIGSCWIDVLEEMDALRNKLNMEDPKDIVAMAALGYPKKNIFGIETSVSDRESIEDLVFLERWGQPMELDILNQRGLGEIFYYVRHAPSWGNIQPWRFILDNDKLVLIMLNDEKYGKGDSIDKEHDLDCGIIMLYIEKMMHKKGIRGKWSLDLNILYKDRYNIPKNSEIKGYFPI